MTTISEAGNAVAGPGLRDRIGMLLRGAGQVMFQRNAWTGLLFLCGIFWGAYAGGHGAVAWGALLGLFAATAAGSVLRLPQRDGDDGLWGFNGILVGCAFPTFLGGSVWMWLALVLCAALTVWVRAGFNNVMGRWGINSLTFPFVLCTWIFLLAARAMIGLPDTGMGEPALPGAAAAAALPVHFGTLAAAWLRGVAQVFLLDSWVTGALFLAGLAVADFRAALWAAAGSAIGLATGAAFGASGHLLAQGLYGYSPVLTAIALATVFYKPGVRSAVWALVGTVVTVFVQAAMNVAAEPLGVATLTAPFCVVTWLFLLPRLVFGDPAETDHTNWNPENKRHLARRHGAGE
jgi:urea transporter